MATALRRGLSALQNLTEARGATPREAQAARLAEQRIRNRLRAAGEALEWPHQSEPYQDGPPQQPGPTKQRARRKAGHERPKQNRMRMGDLIDCVEVGHPLWRPCACGCTTFQVSPGINGVAVALLCCVQCRRSRKLRREHFEVGGRWAD